MKDQAARIWIEQIQEKQKEDFRYCIQHLTAIVSKVDALMTHLNLEFEDIKPGIRVKRRGK